MKMAPSRVFRDGAIHGWRFSLAWFCAYTVSVLASLAGSCVEDCSNRNNLVLAAVAGGIPGRNRLPRYVDTMFDLPKSAPRLAARGSNGRYTVQSDAEYDAMFAVRSNPPGTVLPTAMGDSRWLGSEGWVKMEQVVGGVKIHYNRRALRDSKGVIVTVVHGNPLYEVDDFKFKE